MTGLRTVTAAWLAGAALAVAQDSPQRGYLGVGTVQAGDGERVVSVDPTGAAAEAGLKVGDVILRLDDQPINAGHTLRGAMNAKKASQKVAVTVRDASGAMQTKSVALRERPAVDPATPRSLYRLFGDDDTAGFEDIAQMQFVQPGPRPMLGVTVLDANPELRERLKLGNAPGVIITEVRPDTPAAGAKLQVNDLVQAIDNKAVTNAGELQQIIAGTKPDSQVKLKVLRNGQTIEVPVTVKSMPFPGMPTPRFPGMGAMPGMSGPGVNADLVSQINELRQRVQMLEARIQQLEARAGGAVPGVGGPPASAPPRPAPKGPAPLPRGGGSQPDR